MSGNNSAQEETMMQIIQDALRYRRLRALGVIPEDDALTAEEITSRCAGLDAAASEALSLAGNRSEGALKLQKDAGTVIDRKFIILAVNPVNGKVYTERNSLLLCAKDAAVPGTIIGYAAECDRLGTSPDHTESIRLLYQRVCDFQSKMGGGRVPDTVGAEVPRCLNGVGI